jgi:hypothetical protein
MGDAANTNLIVFGLTRSRLKPTIYHTRGKHANHRRRGSSCTLYIMHYTLQLYLTYYALQLYLTYYALQLLFLQTVLVEYVIEVIFIICSQITLFKTQSSIWWKMCTQKTISIHISSLYYKLNAAGENGVLLLLPNTDRLQQVEDYVRCCTTSTKYWPPSTSWRLCQMLHMAIENCYNY